MTNCSGSTRQSAQRAFGLIEMLVVVVVMAVLALVVLRMVSGGGAKRQDGNPATAISKAHDSECQTNLGSVRQSIAVAKVGDPDAKNPASLDEMRELPRSLKVCPVGGEPYVYDPSTGQVHCVHPGHESY